MKEKSIDNTKMLAIQQKRTNRLNSIKNGIEGGTIKEFEQIFSIVSESRMCAELGISFYSFRNKWKNPTAFTIKEIMRLAALIGVKYTTMADFILHKVKENSKSRLFRD